VGPRLKSVERLPSRAIYRRLTQFPQILKTYDITAAQVEKEASRCGCHLVTISFSGPTQDPARRGMNFLKEF
jgi:hypothetical protein